MLKQKHLQNRNPFLNKKKTREKNDKKKNNKTFLSKHEKEVKLLG